MRLIVIIVCTLLLASCAMIPPKPLPKRDWQTRKHLLSDIRSWRSNGAVSIHTRKGAVIGNFNWQQNSASHYDMTISGPFDIGGINIMGRPGKVTLTNNKGVFHATSPEALMRQQLGWSIPLASLYFWVRGLPAPGSRATTKFDQGNHLIALSQLGWNIRFANYRVFNDVALPTTMYLNARNLRVKMAVKRWYISS